MVIQSSILRSTSYPGSETTEDMIWLAISFVLHDVTRIKGIMTANVAS